MFLYLGGHGEDQTDLTHSYIPANGGWNFGGKGGIDFNNDTGSEYSLENGARGGGAVDLRLVYYDINQEVFDENLFNKSLDSRIIVAGSGGGGASGEDYSWGLSIGFPGGNTSAISNGPDTHG